MLTGGNHRKRAAASRCLTPWLCALLIGLGVCAEGHAASRVLLPTWAGVGKGYDFPFKPSTWKPRGYGSNDFPDTSIVVRRLSWRGWGKRTATGTGRASFCDPDNGGCTTYRVRIRVSQIRTFRCSDSPAFRAYTRGSMAGAKIMGPRPVVFTPLFQC